MKASGQILPINKFCLILFERFGPNYICKQILFDFTRAYVTTLSICKILLPFSDTKLAKLAQAAGQNTTILSQNVSA